MYMIALGLWALFLIAAIAYAQRERHPESKPLAAYMIFVIAFTVTAFVIFGTAVFVLQATGYTAILDNPVAAVLFLILVFGPAFLVGRWQLRKPPRRPRQP
jgi:hypothetical protein